MSKTTVTEKGKDLLTSAIAAAVTKESPLFKENDKLYFKYNKIKIENQSGFWNGEGIVVSYCWNDIALIEQRSSGVKLEMNSTLHLNGIEGRIEVNFDFS